MMNIKIFFQYNDALNYEFIFFKKIYTLILYIKFLNLKINLF